MRIYESWFIFGSIGSLIGALIMISIDPDNFVTSVAGSFIWILFLLILYVVFDIIYGMKEAEREKDEELRESRIRDMRRKELRKEMENE